MQTSQTNIGANLAPKQDVTEINELDRLIIDAVVYNSKDINELKFKIEVMSSNRLLADIALEEFLSITGTLQ